MLNRDRIVSQLNTDTYVQGLILGDCVDSTNAKVKEMALRGAVEGVTMIAETQTGGRGRLGRTFASPEGGLYLSILLRPVGMISYTNHTVMTRKMQHLFPCCRIF